MYPFQTNQQSRRKSRRIIRLLVVLLFIMALALASLTTVYLRQQHSADAVREALSARAFSEADSAQSAVYRLTQSSGTNTMSLLSGIRSHIYAMQSLNTLASNIYGADTYLVPPDLLDACTATLDTCEIRLQAGGVLTTQFTELRDQIDAVAKLFGL